MLSKEELVREISERSKKSEEEIKKLIKDKELELSGLVSEEGAAYIVGRELGVNLIKETKRDLKIKNIVPEMRAVDVVAKVVNVFDVREFQKGDKKGTVASIVLADETGSIRLPLWNEETAIITSLGLSADDLVEVSGAWARTDNRNGTELRLGKKGRIKKLEGGDVPDIKAVQAPDFPKDSSAPAERVFIKTLKPGMNAIVKGCIVQVYKRSPYFEVCPQCNLRLEEKDGELSCKDHGKVEPVFNLLLSAVVDDGTGNVRAVFFRDQAEKVFGSDPAKIRELFEKEGLESFWENLGILGREFMIEGRVKTNDFSNEAEILVNNVADVNVKDECKRLLEEAKKWD